MTKIPDLQIETVPVEKEIKVLVPYKVPYEVKVPYIVQQKVHTHVEHKPVHTSHHIYHPHKKPHYSHHQSWQPSSFPEHDEGKFFLSQQASDVSPLYISHHPVDHPGTSQAFTQFDESPQTSNLKVIRADLNDFTSTLHTSAFNPEIGFGSQEGLEVKKNHQQQQNSYDLQEVGPVMFNSRGNRGARNENRGKFYYVLPQKSEHPSIHYGFAPMKGE